MLVVVWLTSGGNFLAFKVAVETIPPFLMIGVRLSIAGSLMLPIGLLLERAGLPRGRRLRNTLVMGTLLLVLSQGAVVWGVQYLPAGATAVFVSSTPLWLALFQRLRGRPLSGRALAGLALGLAGLALLSSAGADGRGFPPVAVVAVLGGAAAWAAGSLIGHDADLPPPFTGTAVQMLWAGLVLAIVSLATGEAARFDPAAASERSLLALGYLVLFGSMIGFGGYVWLAAAASPTLTATFAYVAPVIALGLGAWLLDEAVTPVKITAAALALAGVALMATGQHGRQPPTCG